MADTTTNTTEANSAVGTTARKLFPNPALILNPAATPHDLFTWAVEDLKNLYDWLNLLACSKCDVVYDPCDVAALVTHRLEPLLQGFDAILTSGRV